MERLETPLDPPLYPSQGVRPPTPPQSSVVPVWATKKRLVDMVDVVNQRIYMFSHLISETAFL